MGNSKKKFASATSGQKRKSNLHESRNTGAYQSEERRLEILDTAQGLFLLVGLEHTTMRDIATHAGVTPVTLYRYFPDLHTIAVQIAARMIKKIRLVSTELSSNDEHNSSSSHKAFDKLCIGMIDQFDQLKDAYRYIGLFDHLYSRSYPSQSLSVQYKNDLINEIGPWLVDQSLEVRAFRTTVLNMIMSFLEKMSARGDLMGNEQGISLEKQLIIFKSSIKHILQGVN